MMGNIECYMESTDTKATLFGYMITFQRVGTNLWRFQNVQTHVTAVILLEEFKFNSKISCGAQQINKNNFCRKFKQVYD